LTKKDFFCKTILEENLKKNDLCIVLAILACLLLSCTNHEKAKNGNMEVMKMEKLDHPVEMLVQTITYKGVEFDVVERPDVFWVGCVGYANDNTGEPDNGPTLKRFQDLVGISEINERINPDWSAALSLNYTTKDKPCGIMFANESYTDKQDERFDIIKQPGGLWLRISNDKKAATAFFGYDNAEPFNPWNYGPYMYFAGAQILQNAARENGYIQNPNVHIQIEYHCHAEYGTPPHRNYAYIPIIKSE
jgi:hypothetical protein